jgi:hypothetical protein
MTRLPDPTSLAAEQGMTLIELMVSMIAGVVVLGALIAVLVATMHQSTRLNGAIQVNQVGRTGIASIVDELHSACTGFGATAIQGPSGTPLTPLKSTGASDLWFISAYASTTSAAAVPSNVTEHDINWASTGKSNTAETLGTLTDYRFASTAGSGPEWKFPEPKIANATSRVIAKNVAQTKVGATLEPIFSYYKLNNSTGALEAIPAGSVSAAAKEVAKVSIKFTQAPENGDTRIGRLAPFSGSVVLRFEPSEAGTEAENAPCS